MPYPHSYRYTTEHEWVAPAGGTAKIGITDFAQHQLGDIVFVELPAVGAVLTRGQAFATVESVKAVSEIFAPISGTVTAINSALATAPERLNSDPHGEAWLVAIAPADPAQAETLMDAAAYEHFLADDASSH